MDGGEKLPMTAKCGNFAKRWQQPEWLESWRATELPPVPADEIRRSLNQVDGLLAPAHDKAIAVMLLPLGELFGPPAAEAVPRYIEALSDIPADDLATAVYRCMRECKFFPAPVEIRERAEDFHHLRAVKGRLETALWRIDFERRKR